MRRYDPDPDAKPPWAQGGRQPRGAAEAATELDRMAAEVSAKEHVDVDVALKRVLLSPEGKRLYAAMLAGPRGA